LIDKGESSAIGKRQGQQNNIVSTPSKERVTGRYLEKKKKLIQAATLLLNERGIKGMTFADVASKLDLNTTSVTYYFKRKSHMAVAVFEDSLERIEELVQQAGAAETPRKRVRKFIDLNLSLRAKIRENKEAPIAILSDIRALDEPEFVNLTRKYQNIFRQTRDFFEPAENSAVKLLNTARTHVLLEITHWFQAWIRGYSIDDFDRLSDQIFKVFEHGISPVGSHWRPEHIQIDENSLRGKTEGMSESFLRVATDLINRRGYRGVSVDRIAAELNVTKGSFYHHLEAKDDLVIDCFNRSMGRISYVQRAGLKMDGNYWHKVTSVIASLLSTQFYSDAPLLRTTALAALPYEMRADILEVSNRLARRFSGMIFDGIADNSIKMVDPMVASQMTMAMINAAYDMRHWAENIEEDTAIKLYASTISHGLFSNP